MKVEYNEKAKSLRIWVDFDREIGVKQSSIQVTGLYLPHAL